MAGKGWEDDDDEEPSRIEFRWGHSEGITGIDCVKDGNKELLVTCGSDSDLRIWKGFDDGDPVAHELTDVSFSLVHRNGEIYIGNDFNAVEAVSLADGKNLGAKVKFTAPVYHVDVSNDGQLLVAGSGDMTIQIVNLVDTSIPPYKLESHTAPVLSVALDPLKKFLVTSGCDGNVCIWNLLNDGKPEHLVKKFEGVFASSNDITTSETLCRVSWEPAGKLLAIPEANHVALYTRDTWMKLKVLKPVKSKAITSVARFSPCGNFLAAGGADGTLIVWTVKDSTILVECARFQDQITGLVFSNEDSDVIAADKKGRILLLKNFKITPTKVQLTDETAKDTPIETNSPPPQDSHTETICDDEFDDGHDELFADDMEDNEISISKIKAETGFVGDEYVGVDKARKIIIGGELLTERTKNEEDDDDDCSVTSGGSRSHSTRPGPLQPKIVIPFTEPQKSFQPASSPVHLDHRFMVWNNTGIIRNYALEDDEKDAIDIEFHDAAVHHAIHLRNHHDYTTATLTKEVAAFANRKQSDAGSKLFCYHFMAWDSKKEWSTDLPLGEEIIGLAAGDRWVAVSTDMNRIRFFSVGGAQKQIIEVGGQIITTSAHEDLLFVIFHNGIGLHGNQCIAYSIFKIRANLKPFPLVSSEPLPLSPKSQIAWIGFSDEGTPLCSDSEDILRILSGRYWTPFCTMKEHLSGVSDHFWVVGVSELMQKIRAVKCKGMRYPPTLPRPVLMQLNAQMPFCEMGTDKSQLEDRFHRSLMLDALSKKMDKKNFDVDEYKIQAEKELKESLFSLFVLSCKGDWDARGTEYVSMMPSAHAVQVAVKYASKLRKKGLTDRLTAIGRRKLDEEELDVEGDDDDFETLKMGTIVFSNVQNRTLSTTADYSASQDLFADTSRLNNSNTSFSSSVTPANRSISVVPEEENPFIKRNNEEIRRVLGSTDTAGNKFRKDKLPEVSGESGETKGLSVIDSWKKPSEKSADLFGKTSFVRINKGTKKGAEKEKTKGQSLTKDKRKQATLLDMHSKVQGKSKELNSNPKSPIVPDLSEESNDSASAENREEGSSTEIVRNSDSLLEDSTNIRQDLPLGDERQQKRGYLLWFDENQEILGKEFPTYSTSDLTKVGMQRYKALSKEEKQKYLNPITNLKDETKNRKRCRADDDVCTEGEKKSRISSKLAIFARSSDD